MSPGTDTFTRAERDGDGEERVEHGLARANSPDLGRQAPLECNAPRVDLAFTDGVRAVGLEAVLAQSAAERTSDA
jgi:hypothetical protein